MGKDAIYIVGVGGHAVSTYGLALACEIEVAGFVNPLNEEGFLIGLPVATLDNFLKIETPNKVNLIMTIGNNYQRNAVKETLLSKMNLNLDFPSIIHPSCSIEVGSSIGEGSLLFAGVRVGAYSKVGNYCVLNTNCSLDHESEMSDLASLGPGTNVGGRTKIGTRSAILIGGAISNNIHVAPDNVIAANSFLKTSTNKLEVWGGSPAKFIRTRKAEESYY